MKLTAKRKLIFNLLKNNNQPQSAEDIHKVLGEEVMNLSTVYRTLEMFHKEALVSRSYLENKAFYYLNEFEHHHFMVCEMCLNKYEFDCHLDEMIKEIKNKYGFDVLHHDLNFYGICENCISNK